MKCKIADINTILNISSETQELFREYESSFETTDITISVSPVEVKEEMERSEFGSSFAQTESLLVLRKLSEHLASFDALLLHGVVIRIGGKGIIFCAKSGTGKTTHMLLWKRIFGDDLTVINGDKPIVRFENKEPFAYGTIWCGKENLSENSRVKLTDICFIERAEENSISKLKPSEAVNELISQTLLPQNSTDAFNTLGMADELLNNCNLWKIYCNKNIEAAEIASKTILKEGENLNETEV